jgi:hypothetical protein
MKEAEMGRSYSTYRRESGTYRFSVGKSKGKRPHEIPRSRSENNIKMDPKGIGWNGVN